MLPFSRDRGFAQGEQETQWMETIARTRRAGSIFATAATVFIAGHLKFAFLVPVAAASLWELTVWLSSAALLLPAFLWFVHAIRREWQVYTRVVALTGHPGTAFDTTWRTRWHLLREFCWTGRS